MPPSSSGLVLATLPQRDDATPRLLRALVLAGAIAFFAVMLVVDGLLCWREPRNAVS